eukprot:gene20129-26860_t
MQFPNAPVTVSPFLRTSAPFPSTSNPYASRVSHDVKVRQEVPEASQASVASSSTSMPIEQPAPARSIADHYNGEFAGGNSIQSIRSAPTAVPSSKDHVSAEAAKQPSELMRHPAPLQDDKGAEGIEDPINVYVVKNTQLEWLNQKLQHENDVLKVEVYEVKLALDQQSRAAETTQQQLAEAQSAIKQLQEQSPSEDSAPAHSNGNASTARTALRLQKAERALELERQSTQNLRRQLELAVQAHNHHLASAASASSTQGAGEVPSSSHPADESNPVGSACSTPRKTESISFFEDSSELRIELQAVKARLLTRSVEVERLRKAEAEAELTMQQLRDQLEGMMQGSKMTMGEEEQENQALSRQRDDLALRVRATDDRAKACDAVGFDLQRKCEAASATVGRLIEENSDLVLKLNSQSNLVSELQKEVRLQTAGIRTLEQLLMSYRSGGTTPPSTMLPALSALDSEQEDQWKLSMLREEVEKLDVELRAARLKREKLEEQVGLGSRNGTSVDMSSSTASGTGAGSRGEGGRPEEGPQGKDTATSEPGPDGGPPSPLHPSGAAPAPAALDHAQSMGQLEPPPDPPSSPSSEIHALARRLFQMDEELEAERLQIRLLSTQLRGGEGGEAAARQLKAVREAISVGEVPFLPPVPGRSGNSVLTVPPSLGPLFAKPYSASTAAPVQQREPTRLSPSPGLQRLDSFGDLSGITQMRKPREGFWSWLTGAGSQVEVLPF